MKSQDMFVAGHYAEALEELRSLLAQTKRNDSAQNALAERAAEVAIEAGEREYAISLLKPIEERDGTDCLARTLLARAYAETVHLAERDAEITALAGLHKSATNSAAAKLGIFLLEQDRPKDSGMIRIWYVMQPWGPHNTYLYSEVFDSSGGKILEIELDSDDGDQVYFREIHPELVAKGDRRYSLDAFLPDRSSNHVIQFFEGRPSYDSVREIVLAIAERAAKASP